MPTVSPLENSAGTWSTSQYSSAPNLAPPSLTSTRPSQRVSRATQPASSASSRIAAWRGDSPASMKPPGSSHTWRTRFSTSTTPPLARARMIANTGAGSAPKACSGTSWNFT